MDKDRFTVWAFDGGVDIMYPMTRLDFDESSRHTPAKPGLDANAMVIETAKDGLHDVAFLHYELNGSKIGDWSTLSSAHLTTERLLDFYAQMTKYIEDNDIK